jgi:zinc transport system ATP-binding protein
MTNSPIISIRNVSYKYNHEPVLSDINLEVSQGEYLGIIGPNGSGKTTLLKIILGILKPSHGYISLFGSNIHEFENWSRIGYVPQKAGSAITQFPITTEEIVSLGITNNSRIFDFFTKEDKQAIDESLAAVGIENLRKRLINELSGGQQQRAFIARALVSHPDLLILDEPTVGVDVNSQEKFYGLLQDLNRKLKITLVLVSHDIEVVAHEVTKVVCINRTIISHGHPKDVMAGNFIEKLYGKDLRLVVHGH